METITEESNSSVVEVESGLAIPYPPKDEMLCWPGRSVDCPKPREWAVFHSEEEAELPFDFRFSVYIGTCSEHLPLALQQHPTALNFVRPY